MRRIAPILIIMILVAVSVHAATKYWSGAGTWTTGAGGNWSTTSGSVYGTASWNDGDSAVFETTGGTVTLGGNITVSNITFNAVGFTISANTLNFLTNATIDLANSDAGTTKLTIFRWSSPTPTRPAISTPVGIWICRPQ